MDEQWYSVKEKLPDIGQRVRVLVVKEMVYKGNVSEKGCDWMYDAEGEHGIYSWCAKLNYNQKNQEKKDDLDQS